jgi:tRNA1(Val) A37 N6-methylase TrmN6
MKLAMDMDDDIRVLFEDAQKEKLCEFAIRGNRVRIQLHPDVFPCMPISIALATQLPDFSRMTVADVGTGTGLLAIVAAMNRATTVLATDLNPIAVEIANKNFQLNNVANLCRAVVADLLPKNFSMFDAIVSNPPCMPAPADSGAWTLRGPLRTAVDGGADGVEATNTLIKEAATTLRREGRLFIPVVAWNNNNQAIANALHTSGFSTRTLAQFSMPYWLPFIVPQIEHWRFPAGAQGKAFRVELLECKLRDLGGEPV